MKRSHFTQLSTQIRKGFSLVELLVVIAIIAVLAGIAYPVITGAVGKAKIQESQKVATDLVFAIEQFEEKYGYQPYPDFRVRIKKSSSDDAGDGFTTGGIPDELGIYSTGNGDLLRVLMGQDEEINPSNIKFFEYKAAKNRTNGVVFDADGETPLALLDPWGEPYIVVIDYSGERKIDLIDVPQLRAYTDKNGKPEIIHSASAVVASPGPDKEFNDTKDVKSW